jgi:NitT/TauT family transport system substrate-binding protein
VLAASLAAALLLAPAGTAPAWGDDAAVVRVGVMDALTMSPLFVGIAKGYFRDEGIDVELVQFDSASTMVVPLAQGRIDAGGGALSASFYNSVARGLDVRIVADMGNDAPGYGFEQLLVRNDLIKSGRYKTIKDLKGMRIAVNTLGAASTVAIDRLLRKAGLTLADITRVTLPFPQHALAFQNGSIDASVMAEPLASLTATGGAATRVLNADSWYPDQQIAALFYGSTFLRTRRDVGEKFMRGYVRSVRTYNDALQGGKLAGPAAPEVIRILAQSSPIHDPALLRAITPNGVDVNGRLNRDSMRADLKFYQTQGLIESPLTIESTIDDGFLSAALKQLGIDRRRH